MYDCFSNCGRRHCQRCSNDGQYTPHTEERPVDDYTEHDCDVARAQNEDNLKEWR